MKTSNKGFTLIEIMIALMIFAIIATLSAYILQHSFQTDKILERHSQRAHRLNLALALVQRDTQQAIERALRAHQGQLIPAFIGRSNYCEWTRSGFANPGSIEKRSTLKRVAYVCEQGQLLRRIWLVLDSPNRRQYQDQVLLSKLDHCAFSYLGKQGQSMSTWRIQDLDTPGKLVQFPRALHLELSGPSIGQIRLNLPFPLGLYA